MSGRAKGPGEERLGKQVRPLFLAARRQGRGRAKGPASPWETASSELLGVSSDTTTGIPFIHLFFKYLWADNGIAFKIEKYKKKTYFP